MKIAILNSLYPPDIVGGAELSVHTLATALAGEGHEVVVIALSKRGENEALVYKDGVRIYRLQLENLYWYFSMEKPSAVKRALWHYKDTHNSKMARKVGVILEREKPQILHTNSLIGFSVAVWHEAHRQGIPIIHTLRDYYLLCPRSAMYRKNNNCTTLCFDCRLFSGPRLKATSGVAAVVGTSNFILNRHLRFGAFKSSERREVIHNAYDKPKQGFSSREVQFPIRFGFLGRIDSTKGIELLLSAFSQISPEVGELWVGGQGQDDYITSLKAKYHLPNVRYLGFITPGEFFPQIDVLVQPSLWHEPFGRTIIEAYAYDRPVIISQNGGSPEIVEDGKTGYIFKQDNSESLLKSLFAFIDEPSLLTHMIPEINAKNLDFSVNLVLSRYMKLYNEIGQ